jgi:phosphoglycolate phosphatase
VVQVTEENGGTPLAVMFDVDETLISTGGAGAAAWRSTFDKVWGVDADITRYTSGGMTDPEVGRRTFEGVMGRVPTDREMAQLLAGYLRRLPEEVAASVGYRVLPGVPELLRRLVDRGVLLGITSGALEAGAHTKLARGGLNSFFSFGGYGSDSKDRGELTRIAIERAGRIHGHAIDPQDTMVVGDTPLDVQAAHDAGAVAVAVASGRWTVDQLRNSGAEHVMASLEDPFPGLSSDAVTTTPPSGPPEPGVSRPSAASPERPQGARSSPARGSMIRSASP